MNAEINPENRDIRMISHMTVLALSIRSSAIRFGIFERMKNSTRTIVPAIIISTFQLIAPATDDSGRIPVTRKIAAAAKTIQIRFFKKSVIRTYIAMNTIIAIIFMSFFLA